MLLLSLLTLNKNNEKLLESFLLPLVTLVKLKMASGAYWPGSGLVVVVSDRGKVVMCPHLCSGKVAPS